MKRPIRSDFETAVTEAGVKRHVQANEQHLQFLQIG